MFHTTDRVYVESGCDRTGKMHKNCHSNFSPVRRAVLIQGHVYFVKVSLME